MDGAPPDPSRAGGDTPAWPEGPLVHGAGAHRGRRDDLAVGFVDDPRGAVEAADHLLGEVTEDLIRGLEDRRRDLAAGWPPGASTEDLRRAFQAYRAALDRLLATTGG